MILAMMFCSQSCRMGGQKGRPANEPAGHGDLIPEAALQTGAIPDTAHPHADKINAFLAVDQVPEDFTQTGLEKADYLKIIESQVRAMLPYQDEAGRIVEAAYAEFTGSRVRYQLRAK